MVDSAAGILNNGVGCGRRERTSGLLQFQENVLDASR